jgi:class 3 adenylate cyclase
MIMTPTETNTIFEAAPEEVPDVERGYLRVTAESRSDDLSLFSQLSSDEPKSARGSLCDNRSGDGAEGIVRAEATTIRNLRFVLICLIIAAASACGVLIYKLSSKNETDSFQFTFSAAASKLTQTFISVLGENLNYAFIMSVSLSAGVYADSNYQAPFPNVTIAQFDSLTYPTRVHALITNIVWSPLLHTREERLNWEAFALSALNNNSGTNSSSLGQYPPCYMCGEGNEFANPTASLTFPGAGTVECASIQQGAQTGYIGPTECSYYAQTVTAVCGCQKSPITASNATASSATSRGPLAQGIFRLQDGEAVIDESPPPYSPVWQISPSVNAQPVILFNQMSEPSRREALEAMIKLPTPTFSRTMDPRKESIYNITNAPSSGIFFSFFYPVFESLSNNNLVGSLAFDMPWTNLFNKLLPENSDGIVIVLENTLGQMFTYQVANGASRFVGNGDLHDPNFESMIVESSFDSFNAVVVTSTPPQVLNGAQLTSFSCSYRIRIYPSQEFWSKHVTNKPVIFTVIVVMAFGVASFVFLMYDFIVRRLQNRVLNSAKQSEAIVSSMFPALVRDRLFRNGNNGAIQSSRATGKQGSRFDIASENHKARLRTFLSHPPSLDLFNESEPIADLYPNTTVLFADISGFTAWSSEREPSQVFKLLESLYGEFDEIARELGVFKVETIGDCYVAVTGLPEKMKHHAVVMVEFSFRCLTRMHELMSKLELVLGPGTADLTIRVGLHSGPVTAGVLRSERARFQLFGDTMNVASRMESTGKPDKVHVSKETAQLLKDAGKGHWVTKRNELVSVKGKGQMQTYWVKSLPFALLGDVEPMESTPVEINSSGLAQPVTLSLDDMDAGMWGSTGFDSTAVTKTSSSSGRDRLVEWNTDLLHGLLQKIVVKRNVNSIKLRAPKTVFESPSDSSKVQFVKEITEVIEMPQFDERITGDPNSIDIGPEVRSQLRDYVGFIASLYRDNAFHNFEHACHVSMSASKLLKRIIAPDHVDYNSTSGNKDKHHKNLSKEIHKTTFGISSDPLMQFAVVFSALIHDVDHTGLTNKQLMKEDDPLAIKYEGKCVAEQRSIQVAWDKLMEDKFVDLRRCIYQTEDEKQRFRQLLVNAVIATDIADKELSAWRKNRWDKVFHYQEPCLTDGESMSNRKATIVFEYIIQASDVAHTMQHWHVYQKWNKRLFDERYAAYLAGREAEDPSVGWHKGEIWFFDNYIIPLAKKLEECNVFGVSCDEYLTYALQNRHEWEMKGEDIVREMVSSFQDDGDLDGEDFGLRTMLAKKDELFQSVSSLSVVEPNQFNAGVA